MRQAKTSESFNLEGFVMFWSNYPRHEAKKDAWRAWCQVKPNVDAVLTALSWQKRLAGWRQSIQFVPLAGSYLRGERWTDEAPEYLAPKSRTGSWCQHVPKCVSPDWHQVVLARERGEA